MEQTVNIKVIFLDIDGVLNNMASLAEGIHLIPEKCLKIRRLIKQTGAKIVISSTWRIGTTLKELKHILWRSGVPSSAIIGMTNECGSIRGDEVMDWLNNNPHTTNFVIIDDDSDFHLFQQKHFVQTNIMHGLVDRDIDKAIEILNR